MKKMLNQLKLPNKLREIADEELQPGELIRWVEQPIPRFFTRLSIAKFLFAIPWTSFTVFVIYSALGLKLPELRKGLQPQHLIALIGLPSFFLGLEMLLSPLWEWKRARNTVYLITDKRAISVRGDRPITIKSFSPDLLQNVYRKEKADGSGDVVITVRGWKDSDGDPWSGEIGFFAVRNPQEVEKLLKQLAQTAS